MGRIPPVSSGRSRLRRLITASARPPTSNERDRDSRQTPDSQRGIGVDVFGAGALFRLHRAVDLSQSSLMDPIDPKKRANRKLVRALLVMTAGAFAFGWALGTLY